MRIRKDYNPFANQDIHLPKAFLEEYRRYSRTLGADDPEKGSIEDIPFNRYIDLWSAAAALERGSTTSLSTPANTSMPCSRSSSITAWQCSRRRRRSARPSGGLALADRIDYWAVSGGVSQAEAKAIAAAEGFDFEIGRISRFENARNAVIIAKADLKDDEVNRLLLADLISEKLQSRGSDEWETILNAAGIPCGPIYTVDQVYADPQVVHLGMAQPVKTKDKKPLRMAGQPMSLSRTPSKLAAPPPGLGEHTDQVLKEFGFSAKEIAALHKARAV